MSERGREWKLEVYLDRLSEGGGGQMVCWCTVCVHVCVCVLA